jgi:predicted RNA polymerase sigma factor
VTSAAAGLEQVARACVPEVLAALMRRHGDFDTCEDAVQEALLAAARQWPADGLPDNPRGWLIRVASRRLVDQRRADQARADREVLVARHTPAEALLVPPADTVEGGRA